MKKLYKNIRNSILILPLLFSQSLFAKPGALVNSVTGNVFSIVNGKTIMLRKGDHLDGTAELITEEASMLTISDYHDHKYHLSGSAHIKMFGGSIELVQGYMWVQSYSNSNSKFLIQSANALVGHKSGEAIISFDPYAGKTQVFSLDGKFEISNILKKDFVQIVDRGEFSFVSNDYENGFPRRATELSRSSYDLVRTLFRGIDPMTKEIKKRSLASLDFDMPTKRAPASTRISAVRTHNTNTKNNNKIIYLRKDHQAESKIRDLRLENYYNKITQKLLIRKKKKKFKPTYTKSSNVTIKIYGQKKSPKKSSKTFVKNYVKKTVSQKKAKKSYRMPASISKIAPKPIAINNDFENSLTNEFKKQMRHSNEVNELIDELKNYDQDYQSGY